VEWVEVTAKSIEEAKESALDQLGVDESDAEFEIVEVPKGGLFGRLRSEARVRARVSPTAPRPRIDRRGRRRQRQGERNSGRRVAETTGSKLGGEEPREGAEMSSQGATAEGGDVAEEFVRGLMDAFGTTCRLERRDLDDDTLEIVVEGEELGLLIGPRGQTLSAVQDLVRTVVQRRAAGYHGRVVVDVGGYRRARREALERFTRQVADQVRHSGIAKVLEPMPPADRKVIHDTINTIHGVVTSSEGEEPRRRVVIGPERSPAE
jgi:spoIIIJ-associated protein